MYLMGLIDGGVDVGPITITPDFRIIDGRHRAEAYKHLDLTTIKARTEEDGNFLTLTGKALNANIGGSLPPTRRDLEHTMIYLIKNGAGRDKIIDEFSKYLPKSLLRVSYQRGIHAVNKQKINRAISLLTDSPTLTIKKVAELVGIDPKHIQNRIDEMNKKSANGKWLASTKTSLSRRFSHFNKSNGQLVRKIFEDFDDGEISEKELSASLEYLSQLISNQNRVWQDWDKRWRSRTKS